MDENTAWDILPSVIGPIASIIAAIVSIIVVYITKKNDRKIAELNIRHQKSINQSNQKHQESINLINQEHQKTIENLKTELNQHFYKFQKKHDREFESIVELWNTLSDIEEIIEGLWEVNEINRQTNAKKAWDNAKKQLRKSEIFIPNSLVIEIQELLGLFKSYIDGKGSLNNISFDDYNNTVEKNRLNKETFKYLRLRLKDVIQSNENGLF